jgi:hypothetical protein
MITRTPWKILFQEENEITNAFSMPFMENIQAGSLDY